MHNTPPTGGPANPVAKARAQVAHYEAAWQDNPHDITACGQLACALLTLAVNLNATVGHVTGTRSGYVARKRTRAESEAIYKRVLTLTDVVLEREPDCIIALEYRRESYLRLKQFKACREVCEELLTVDPSNAMARRHLAYCLYCLGDHAESGRAYERAWELSPEYAGNLARAQDAYTRAGEHEEAHRVAELGAANFPKKLVFQRLILEHAIKGQRFEDALQRAEAMALVDPEDFSLRASAGHALLHLERKDAASAAFQEAIRLAAPQAGWMGAFAEAASEQPGTAPKDGIDKGPGYIRVILWASENGYTESEDALHEMMLAEDPQHIQGRTWIEARMLEQLKRAAANNDVSKRLLDAWALNLEHFLEAMMSPGWDGKTPDLNLRDRVDLLEFLVDIFQHEGHIPCVERCLDALHELVPERAIILRSRLAESQSSC